MSGVPPSSSFAFTSAPFSISSSTTSMRPVKAAPCKGVAPFSSFAFTSVPAAMCCWTALMFPSKAASPIEMSCALAFVDSGGGSGFAASATGSTGFTSGAGVDDCDSPHPARSTAAIVVSRRCFISLRRSSGGVGCSNYKWRLYLLPLFSNNKIRKTLSALFIFAV